MSRPNTLVRIAFDLAAGGVGDFFTLDDPVKGELDNAPFGLAGDILTDVTSDAQAITVRRGRSRELERFQAGALNVTLDNRGRQFDPTAGTAITPYGPGIKPRKEITVITNGQPVFSGIIEDWDLSYDASGDSRASVKATDGFVFLSQAEIEPHTTTPQTTGARIEAILDRPEINWPAGKRDISAGQATLQGDSIGGTADPKPVNALQYLQAVDSAETGAFYIAANGSVRFRDRTELQDFTDVVFSDDGSGIAFEDISVDLGVEELRNRVTVARLNGGTAVAVDAASVIEFGPIDYEIRDSLLADDTQAQRLADFLVTRYSQPQLRIDQIRVNLNRFNESEQLTLLGLDLGDTVQVKFTPGGFGPQIDRFVSIDSIEHTIDTAQHKMAFNFSETLAAFILNSQAFGRLDQNVLGF
jgi:hypothetical protein